MDKKKKTKKETLTIEGIKDKPIWNDILCECAQDPHDSTHRYPLQKCVHCRCQFNQDSLPLSLNGEVKPFNELEPFELPHKNKEGKITVVKHTWIKIKRDKGTDEILGWVF